MGLCQSQETPRRNGNARKRNAKGTRGRNNKNNKKRRDYTESSESDDDSESESESGSDDDSHRRRRRRNKKKGQDKDGDDKDAGANNQVGQYGHKMDTAAYAQQYPTISQDDQDILFYKARTCTNWSPTPIPHELLRNAMKLALLAPSAYNCCPMRVVFVTAEHAPVKAKLLATLDPENVRQTKEAPVTAIVCTDLHYTRNLPKLMPYVPNAQQMFEQYDDLNEMIRIRNSNLQAGYLILALRSLGLAVGPVSGFDNQMCDDSFLEGSSWRSNFLINLGYPHPDVQYPPRLYRLGFDASMKML